MKYTIILLISILSITAYSQSLTTVKSQTGTHESYEDISISLTGGCSLGCGIGWTLTATSTLKSQGTNSYEPANMSDGEKETAWVEGTEGFGIGEKINVEFEENGISKDIPFRALMITNGYAKNLETWENNSRIKVLKLSFNGIEQFMIELADSIYPQYVEFNREILVSNGDVVTFEITEVFEGRKYKDTAISDLSLHGAH